jgi:hypothetical protein
MQKHVHLRNLCSPGPPQLETYAAQTLSVVQHLSETDTTLTHDYIQLLLLSTCRCPCLCMCFIAQNNENDNTKYWKIEFWTIAKKLKRPVNKRYTIHHKTKKTTIKSWHSSQSIPNSWRKPIITSQNLISKFKKWETRILKSTQTQLKQETKDSIFMIAFQVGHFIMFCESIAHKKRYLQNWFEAIGEPNSVLLLWQP